MISYLEIENVNPWGALSAETDHFHKFLDILIFYTK